jgi:hypothetical protein
MSWNFHKINVMVELKNLSDIFGHEFRDLRALLEIGIYMWFIYWFHQVYRGCLDANILWNPSLIFVTDVFTFSFLQFTTSEVEASLLVLDVCIGAVPGGLLIVQNCDCVFLLLIDHWLFERSEEFFVKNIHFLSWILLRSILYTLIFKETLYW